MCKTYHLTTDMINAAQEEVFLTSMRNLPSFPTFLSEAKFASSKIPKRSIAKDKKRHINKAEKGEEGVGMSEKEFKALEVKKAVISKEILSIIPKGIVKKQLEVLDKSWYRNGERMERNEGETLLSTLMRTIQVYVDSPKGKENTFKTAKEWLEITGLCGFKNNTTYHSSVMTQLVQRSFLERKNNKLRLIK